MEKINDTAERIRQCNARQKAGRSEWIEATLEKARLFAAERARMPDNRAFAMWLVDNEIDESKDDRAAYIEIGENVDVWRTIIECCESMSVQWIVRDHRVSAEKLVSLRQVTKNAEADDHSAEQPEIAPETQVSEEPASENSAVQGNDRPPQFAHRGLVKAIGQSDAEFLSNFYYSNDGRFKKLLASIGTQKGGPNALSRLADTLRSGEYGTSSGASASKDGLLHPGLFVRGAPLRWAPPGFPKKVNPAALNKIVDMMPAMKAVADALAATPSKPDNKGAFCDHQWELLRRAKNAAPIAAPAAEPVAEPATEEVNNVVSIGDTRRIVCLGTQLWPIPDADIYGLGHLSYEDARAAYDIVHEMVTILRAPAVLDAESIGRKIRHMTTHIRAIANGVNVAELMSKGTYAMKGDAEVHLLKDAAPPVVKFA